MWLYYGCISCAREQGGSHVEVLSAQGRDPMSHCKVTGTVIRRYVAHLPPSPSPSPSPNTNYCAISVGMIRVSVVTFIQWKEIALQQEYSSLPTTDHPVSRAVWRMCPTVPLSPPCSGTGATLPHPTGVYTKGGQIHSGAEVSTLRCNRGNPSY